MTFWKLSDDWLRNHTSPDLVYTVVRRLDSPDITQRVWQQFEDRVVDGAEVGGGPEGHPTVLWGGAYLELVGDREIEAGSGGEDALDSLNYAINELLANAIASADVSTRIKVVSAARQLVKD